MLGFAVAANVRFDVGAGFTVPTQAVFVPMLFALPASVVPLLVMLALALGMVPQVLRRKTSPSWLITAAGNSWYALGPAVVFVIADVHAPTGRLGILLLALAAQFAFDFLAAAARDRRFGDFSLAELLSEVRPIYAIDLALSSLGFVVAFAAWKAHAQWPVLLIAPLFLVLRVFSKERHERLEQLAELNDAYQGTALLLGDVVESDDSYTGEHSKSVVRLALDVADAMGLDADRKRNVEFGALLHDVGKNECARIGAAPASSLAHVPRWEADRVRELAERSGASILVTGPTFPGLFDELEPRRVAQASSGPSAQWRDASRVINWTIIPAATIGWATHLRPHLSNDEALRALWEDLAHVCRLDEPDPVAAWRARLAALRGRATWLTALELDAIRLEGPDTDLTIGLLPKVRWECAEMTTPRRVAFVANLPTEEVYTTPDPTRVDGHVRLTRPVIIGGCQIADVLLRFSGGRVVDIAGPSEASALQEFVARDLGAARLGEPALVDADSRVAGLGHAFGEILLDENAASHIALGYGFPALIPACSVTGANASDHHLDVMIGSPEVQVTGIDRSGDAHPLLREARWVEPMQGDVDLHPDRLPAPTRRRQKAQSVL